MSTSTQLIGNAIKKSRTDGFTEVDHISNLPDCVISLILSLLSTSEAVRTSVLSKDWKYKWTFSNNIQLDDAMTLRDPGNENLEDSFAKFLERKTTFANFVDRTLLLSQHLQSFRLSCWQKFDLNRMETWISAALSSKIHNLYIYYRHGGIVLPCNLLNCYSLKKLDLSIIPSSLKVPASIFFPYLTILKLNSVKILNEVSLSDVVKLNLPVLETFELRFCKWLNVKFVEIYAPKMTTFMSLNSIYAGVSDYSFIISGGSLLKYETYGGLPEHIILSGGSEVVCADIKGCSRVEDLYSLKNSGIQIRKLVNEFLSLEELVLSGVVVQAMGLTKPGLSFPKYYKMERLKLYRTSNPEVLLELLHAASVLKFLLLYMGYDHDYDYDAEEYVPSCIVSHLEKVEFNCNTGKRNLAKFIVKNATKLKTMRVSCKEIAEELSSYPKASTCLTIVVSDM